MLLKRKQCIARLNWTSRSLVGAVSVRHGFKTFVPLLQSTEEISQTKPFPPRLADAVQIFKNSIENDRRQLTSWETLEKSYPEQSVILTGYLGQRVDLSKGFFFIQLYQDGHPSKTQRNIQIVSAAPILGQKNAVHDELKTIEPNSLIRLEATVTRRKAKPAQKTEENSGEIQDIELVPTKVSCLSRFSTETIYTKDTNFPPEQRHLQLRSQPMTRRALVFRHNVMKQLRESLQADGFIEIETPILFKPTPEGAREFLVPTRHEGKAYALVQSPQQLKQMLQAATIPKYFQFAKCFRDEDLRADRQPEFTQLDIEMNLAHTQSSVMEVVESLTRTCWNTLIETAERSTKYEKGLRIDAEPFKRMTYEEAMSRFGSDKPDVRLGMELMPITDMVSTELKSMISQVKNPVVEMYKLHVSDSAQESMEFVRQFMDSPAAKPFQENPDGAPGMFIFDPRKPLKGLSAFGFEAAEQLSEALCLEEGDVIAIQARKDQPFHGGSTALGNLRLALYKAAVQQKLLPEPAGFEFLWVTHFPMFSPTDGEPGQGGTAGIKATHHPFTAPASVEDLHLFVTDPLRAKAAHYDLVVNGVELGGGSTRLHVAALQEYVFRDVLKMPEARIADFEHLTRALGDGCPPHGGFAMGFDRLVALMLGRESIRDVMAFPKMGRGEDPMVGAPSEVGDETWRVYHLKRR